MATRTASKVPVPEHSGTHIMQDGRLLVSGQEVRVTELQGWFRFKYVDSFGNLVFWGPQSQNGQSRTFHEGRVGKFKGKKDT